MNGGADDAFSSLVGRGFVYLPGALDGATTAALAAQLCAASAAQGADPRAPPLWPRGGARRVFESAPAAADAPAAWAALARAPALRRALDSALGAGTWELPVNDPATSSTRHFYAPTVFPESPPPPCPPPPSGSSGSAVGAVPCACGGRPRVCPWGPAGALPVARGGGGVAACLAWSPVSRRRWAGGGWHVDVGPGFGNDEPRTRAGDARQGAVVLVLLSDCAAGGGGTALLPGSHRWVAAEVAARAAAGGAPYTHEDLNAWCVARMRALTEAGRVLLPGCGAKAAPAGDGDWPAWGGGGDVTVEQVIGAAGDVVLLHPLLLHSGTTNACAAPRLMLNGMARITPAAFAAHGARLLRALDSERSCASESTPL
jgi:hypothetical protein